MQKQTRVYSNKGSSSIVKILGESLRDFFGSHFLAKQLAKRDIKAQYRQSYLGLLWAFITPITTALVWVFLQKSGTVKLTDTGMAYPIFAFSGTFIWSIVVEAINSPVLSTNASRGIISKINFPKEALLLSGIYKIMFNSIPKILILAFFLYFFGASFHASIWLFPLVILGAIFFGFSLGLIITPISLLYTDISKLIQTGLRFLMYVSPVVYAVPSEGLMKTIMEYNPFTPIILMARDTLVGNPGDNLSYYLIVLGCCVPIFLIALVFYRVSIPIIVERSSS